MDMVDKELKQEEALHEVTDLIDELKKYPDGLSRAKEELYDVVGDIEDCVEYYNINTLTDYAGQELSDVQNYLLGAIKLIDAAQTALDLVKQFEERTQKRLKLASDPEFPDARYHEEERKAV